MENTGIILFEFIIFYLLCFSLLCSFIAFSQLNQRRENILQAIVDNHSHNLIYSISDIPSSNLITQSSSLIDFSFPGTKSGCFCSNTNPQELYSYECSDNRLSNNCTTIISLNKSELFSWKNKVYQFNSNSTINSSNQFTTLYTYFEYINFARKGNETCPESTKNCGILDTLGNILCIDNTFTCPINSVYYSSSENRLRGNFTISPDQRIISNIRTSESVICSLDYQEVILRKRYLLEGKDDITELVSKCDKPNSYFYLIDSSSLSDFYSTNNIISNITSLPLFSNEYTNGKINLYSTPFTGWSLDCISKGVFPSLVNSKLAHFQKIRKIYISEGIGVMTVMLIILLIKTTITEPVNLNTGKSTDQSLVKVVIITSIVLSVISVIVNLIFNNLKITELQQCLLDDSVSYNLSLLAQIDKTLQYIRYAKIIISLSIMILLCFGYYFTFIKKRFNEESTVKEGDLFNQQEEENKDQCNNIIFYQSVKINSSKLSQKFENAKIDEYKTFSKEINNNILNE